MTFLQCAWPRPSVSSAPACARFRPTSWSGRPVAWPWRDCQPARGDRQDIQPSIGMDMRLLREMVGPKLCLFGGVDCATLVAGTPDDVRREARYAVTYAGSDGGLVLVSSNTLMVGVKYENCLAMLAARDY